MTPVPTTCVVGVGRAGINILSALDELLTTDPHRDRFELIAVDSDVEGLEAAPDDTRKVFLEPAIDFIREDKASYPYLTEGMEIETGGSNQQRPVGRYMLDSRPDTPRTFDSLWSSIEQHVINQQTSLSESVDWLSVYLVGSLSGGTGSGTFPLLAAMLDEILNTLESDVNDNTLVGFGLVPSLVDSPHLIPTQSASYVNAYAALRNLETLLSASRDEQLELPLYSMMTGADGGGLEREFALPETLTLETPPFDSYFLVGQRERPSSDPAAGVPATYRSLVNRRVAAAIQAHSLSSSLENNLANAPRTGTVDRSAVRVPHDRVREVADLRGERQQCEEEIANIESQIADIDSRIQELEAVRREPLDGPMHLAPSGGTIGELIGAQLPGLGAGSVTPDEIEQFVGEVTEEWNHAVALYATTVLEEQFPTEELERLDTELTDTVEQLWARHGGHALPGGEQVSSVNGRASFLDDYLRETIDELEDTLEEIDKSLLDLVPPYADALKSESEALNARLERIREDFDTLNRVRERFERLESVLSEIRSQQSEARHQLSKRIQHLENERFELKRKFRQRKEKLDRIEAESEALEKELVDAETARQLAVLPIDMDVLAELDIDTAEQVDEKLPSIAAYLEHGLVEEDMVADALTQAVEFSRAWKDPIIERDLSETDDEMDSHSSDQMWVLCAEDNTDLIDLVERASQADREEVSGGNLAYLPDPHRIEFVSFASRGPLSSIAIYRQLDNLADEQVLAELRGPYEDWQQSFAYPEWYDSEIQWAFDIVSRIAVPRPPEPDPNQVIHPDSENESDLMNYIKTNGLDAYLWRGTRWEQYSGDELFSGWQPALSRNAISFSDLQTATPPPEMKAKWLAGQLEWDEVVAAYGENLYDEIGIDIEFR